MAVQAVTIRAAVGKRHGITPLANQAEDVATITNLLDRIADERGGTATTPGVWPTDRPTLIDQLAEQIRLFQSKNLRFQPDWAVDPGGTTLRVMNAVAAEPSVAAYVAGFGGYYEQDFVVKAPVVAASASLPGTGAMEPTTQSIEYSRRLIMVTGSSIKWFGVVVPTSVTGTLISAVPHLFFTPTPVQGGYSEGNYDSFGGWDKLWDDYTDRIGSLLAASGVNQVLVIPFYRTAQMGNLGMFLVNWMEVVSAVVTAAVNDMHPYYMPGAFTFDSIVSSSFSNGVTTHRNFNTRAAGANDITSVLFDLDGQAQTGGSNWRPANGVIYLNTPAPRGVNPQGRNWYVGGRWGAFDAVVPQTSRFSHHACSVHLLAHGLSEFSA